MYIIIILHIILYHIYNTIYIYIMYIYICIIVLYIILFYFTFLYTHTSDFIATWGICSIPHVQSQVTAVLTVKTPAPAAQRRQVA